ncbi:uncharacterized protein [Ambystoma mexicanum]|uniref:uncharacterized protein n=1 Tax=Ambystoma mexicanum TaxID=8296 RepID=UPI0037E86E89
MVSSVPTGVMCCIFKDGEVVVPICWKCHRRGQYIDPEMRCDNCQEAYFQPAQCTIGGDYLQWSSAQTMNEWIRPLSQEKAAQLMDSELSTTICAVDNGLSDITVGSHRATDGDVPLNQTSVIDAEGVSALSEGTALLSLKADNCEGNLKIAELLVNTDACSASVAQNCRSATTVEHGEVLVGNPVIPGAHAASRIEEWLETSFQHIDLEIRSCSDGTNLLSESMDVASVSMAEEEECSSENLCVVQTTDEKSAFSFKSRQIDCLSKNISWSTNYSSALRAKMTACNTGKSESSSEMSHGRQKWRKLASAKTEITCTGSIPAALYGRWDTVGPSNEVQESTDVWVLPATPYRNGLLRLSKAEREVRTFVKNVWGVDYPYVTEEVMDFVETNRDEWLRCWVAEEIKKKRVSPHKEDHPHFMKALQRLLHNWQIGRSIRKHAVIFTDPNGCERLKSVRVTNSGGKKVVKPDPDYYEL